MKGYEERTESEASMLRIASYRIHQSLVQKPLKINDYWPLPSDKKVNKEVRYMRPEMLTAIRNIKKVHKIK